MMSCGSFFFSSRRRHTRWPRDWSSDVCSSDLKELDKAAENWKRLGFTVSARGTHSAHMGSGNYTIMFDPDYMELLGVLTETEHNAPARSFLAKHGDGIERVAFT